MCRVVLAPRRVHFNGFWLGLFGCFIRFDGFRVYLGFRLGIIRLFRLDLCVLFNLRLWRCKAARFIPRLRGRLWLTLRSEEHTSELQSLMRISYAVFCLKKKINTKHKKTTVELLKTYTLHRY